ncbi:MAG: bifunctional UDP-N-acetylglucosamine diphosphorylase/glucosamine-1-phosphate N-acetyltransferase GlmU [Chloroflexi bacterium]|nr:bifunctional UDP-N-acetylglucosamine diphosphorylase/glucosamine-1-phosphate N-acetyltransferase GlmU [Chloroflexota bacterium]
MRTLAAIILAAGQGTRMKTKINKVLHPVAGKPMVLHVLDALFSMGVDKSVLVVGHEADQVRQALGDRVEYVEQREQLGTGHAVMQAREALQGRFDDVLVLCGDAPLITAATLRRLRDLQLESGATVAMLSALAQDPTGYGRVLRKGESIVGIVEDRAASPEERAIREINSGFYCFDAEWLWKNVNLLQLSEKGEYYLTDVVALAAEQGRAIGAITVDDVREVIGINNRVQLAEAEAVLRERIRRKLMLSGVTLIDPAHVYVDGGVEVGPDSVIYPGTILEGQTRIGERCVIGPNTVLRNCAVGSDCSIMASVMEDCIVGDRVTVGPFSHVRAGAQLAGDVHLGNFAEIKNSRLGERTKMGHFSYLGDAEVGCDVNVGAGTITCNYDSETKSKGKTILEDHVALGSDTMLVAPVKVGHDAVTGAGSVVTRDIPAETVAVGAPARVVRKVRKNGRPVGS